MNISEKFNIFKKSYDENTKTKIWSEQSSNFKKFWKKLPTENISKEEERQIIRYLDKHGEGNKKSDEALANIMIPQNKWYKIFENLKTQIDLYSKMNYIMYQNSDSNSTIDEIFKLNIDNKNNLTGPSGSGICIFLSIADPINQLSIVSLNHRFAILDYLNIDYNNLANKNIGFQIIETNKLILNYFINNKISNNARTISVFFYSKYERELWDKKLFNQKNIFFKIQKNDYLHILKEEIEYLNIKNRSEWAITITNNKIRVHFGCFIVFSIENEFIWLTINSIDSNNLENLSYWKWDNKDYPKYKKYNLFSKNGYFNGKKEDWNNIKKYHLKFINQISDKQYKLKKQTKDNHDNEIIFYLMRKINVDIPIPLYSITNENTINIENEIKIIDFTKINETEKEIIIKNRIGQNIFRANLINFHKKCMLCGIQNPELLRASHIKPWCESTNSERLDFNNGLLLCANHDLLFDKLLITFNKLGEIVISKKINSFIYQLNLNNEIKIKMDFNKEAFMKWHREKFKLKNR